MFELNACNDASVGKCVNRAAWILRGERIVVMLAEGAGSKTDAAFAAEFAIKCAAEMVGQEKHPLSPGQWLNIVSEIDVPLSLEPAGETTFVVADVGPKRISGASVGDSKVFIVDTQMRDLTSNQQRKPLLGSGQAVTNAYEEDWSSGELLLCNAGLHKYAARDKLVTNATNMDARALIELARLPNGALFDDAVCVLLRRGKAATGHLPEGTIQHVRPA